LSFTTPVCPSGADTGSWRTQTALARRAHRHPTDIPAACIIDGRDVAAGEFAADHVASISILADRLRQFGLMMVAVNGWDEAKTTTARGWTVGQFPRAVLDGDISEVNNSNARS
jgi:hypothetical protein